MQPIPPRFDARAVESSTQAFWAARDLLAADGPVGPAGGPLLHQMLATLSPSDGDLSVLQRLVAADAQARYFALAGRRTWTTLQYAHDAGTADLPALFARVREFGIRSIGTGSLPAEDERRRLQEGVERLVRDGWLVARTHPLHTCPRCATPRTPQTIIYQEEAGTVHVVAFTLRGFDPPTRALVWVETAWKLLGTTAVLVHPDRPYVRARVRHHGREVVLLLDRMAMPRLSEWLPGAEVEVLEERPGRDWAGIGYDHPLAIEYPAVASLPPPAGTIVASADVAPSGSGIVPLVPSHGGRDAEAAETVGLSGGPVVTSGGTLDATVSHTYAGLSLEAAEAFILRDLAENGNLVAQVGMSRGVPHCALCGTPLVWVPSRVWSIDPRRLADELPREVGRLLPAGGTPPARSSAVPWPVSESRTCPEDEGVELRECPACDRLSPSNGPERCECGATPHAVRRRLLPALLEAMRAFARHEPLRTGDEIRLFLPERRRVPALVHFLLARQALAEGRGDLKATVLPTLNAELPDPSTLEGTPRDAYRMAILSAGEPFKFAPTFADRRVREARRLRVVWGLASRLAAISRTTGFFPDAAPLTSHLDDLLPEDRAILSLFETLRTDVWGCYEAGRIPRAHALLARFLDVELRAGYLPLVRHRLDHSGLPADRIAVLRVLWHVLPIWVELFGPIAPFTMEAIHRALFGDAASLFRRRFTPLMDGLHNPALEATYRRWQRLTHLLERGRRRLAMPDTVAWPSLVLIADDEQVASELTATTDVIARLVEANAITVASARSPWKGRQIAAIPVREAIQRVYPSEASRIVRLLERLPAQRIREGLKNQTLTVALEARTVQLLPSMIEFDERIPAGFAPLPWEEGEIFVEVPSDFARGRPMPPPLSLDAFRLVESLRRRVGRAAPGTIVKTVVHVEAPVGPELARKSAALADYLGIGFEVTSGREGFVAAETIEGRGRRGARWAYWIPGLARTRRPAKTPRARSRVPRASPPRRSKPAAAAGPDLLDEAVLRREEAIHASLERLDGALGIPILGPAKMGLAWDAGFRDFDAIASAPFDRLSAVPGFGPYVAAYVVQHFGGPVPDRLPRPSPRRAPLVQSRRPVDRPWTGAEHGGKVAEPLIPTASAAVDAGAADERVATELPTAIPSESAPASPSPPDSTPTAAIPPVPGPAAEDEVTTSPFSPGPGRPPSALGTGSDPGATGSPGEDPPASSNPPEADISTHTPPPWVAPSIADPAPSPMDFPAADSTDATRPSPSGPEVGEDSTPSPPEALTGEIGVEPDRAESAGDVPSNSAPVDLGDRTDLHVEPPPHEPYVPRVPVPEAESPPPEPDRLSVEPAGTAVPTEPLGAEATPRDATETENGPLGLDTPLPPSVPARVDLLAPGGTSPEESALPNAPTPEETHDRPDVAAVSAGPGPTPDADLPSGIPDDVGAGGTPEVPAPVPET
ncbi:MAG: class I tRNA ligase family protein, partial [Thermoplasmata archaeon]